jgi:hypothetical protein
VPLSILGDLAFSRSRVQLAEFWRRGPSSAFRGLGSLPVHRCHLFYGHNQPGLCAWLPFFLFREIHVRIAPGLATSLHFSHKNCAIRRLTLERSQELRDEFEPPPWNTSSRPTHGQETLLKFSRLGQDESSSLAPRPTFLLSGEVNQVRIRSRLERNRQSNATS